MKTSAVLKASSELIHMGTETGRQECNIFVLVVVAVVVVFAVIVVFCCLM